MSGLERRRAWAASKEPGFWAREPSLWAPWLTIAVFGAYLLSTFSPPPAVRGMDAAGFGRLPALHDGRVKPLDTIARVSLLMIRGKQTATDAAGRRLSADEWLLDALSRPELADSYEIFEIDDPDLLGLLGKRQGGGAQPLGGGVRPPGRYFSMRDLAPSIETLRAQADQADKVEAKLRTRFQNAAHNLWDRLVLYRRLSESLEVSGTADFTQEIGAYLAAVSAGVQAVMSHQKSGSYDASAFKVILGFFERYQYLSRMALFRPLSPSATESPDQWSGMGDGLMEAMRAGEGARSPGGTLHPAVMLYARMLDAWRRQDAAAFNSALVDYRRLLDKEIPRVMLRCYSEALFNRVEPFYQGMVLYVAVFILAVASWLVWPQVLQRCAFYLLMMAFGVHTLGLAARIVLQGRPPVTNLYSSAIFVGWAAVLLGLVVERMSRKGFGSAVASLIGFSTLIIAHHLAASGDTMEMMRAVLDSNFWLSTHVVAITVGYASTFLAGALAYVYIFRGLLTRSLTRETAQSLASMTYGVVCFSLLFSFVGTILGGIWADQSWGRFWGWDPKENGALLIVLWNAVILHARWAGYARERGLMAMVVFGNAVTALSWFGVNMLGIGLHSYGWMDKAFYWLAIFVAAQLAVMSAALLPPRYWKSRPAG